MSHRPCLALITHRTAHHAQHSGSSPLADHLPAVAISREANHPLPWRLQRMLARRRSEPYNTASVTKELALLAHMIRRRGGLAHFLHGEHDFYYTGFWARTLGWRAIATFHYPPARLRELLPRPAFLRRLDGLIAVGSNQIPALREMAGHDRVWFIPYGIDCAYFTPDPSVPYRRTILTVGQHLRDFRSLRAVLLALHERCPELNATALVGADHHHKLPDAPWLVRKSDVMDEDLRAAYRSAALLLLPLEDGTACNSLLEALACGLPIVTTDVGAVRDYVDERCAVICPKGDVGAMVEAAERLLIEPALNTQMRIAARQQALKFAWPEIARQHTELYRHEFGFDVYTSAGE